MGRTTGPERGGGVPAVRRNRQITVAVAAYSGEGFRQPGGADWRGIRGESERRRWAFIGVAGAPFLLRINEGEWGVVDGVGYQ
jgi:hypothetical protein